MWPAAGVLCLGWTLGRNDAANIFGTAVAARVIHFRTAGICAAVAVLIGALHEGAAGLTTISSLVHASSSAAGNIAIAAALTVGLLNYLRFPVSTTQAVIGAIIGAGLTGTNYIFSGVAKLVFCWFVTPIGACLISVVLFWTFGRLLSRIPISILVRDRLLWGAVILAGVYGSYALGANNVGSVTGVFISAKMFTPNQAALVGGVAMAGGTLFFHRRVSTTVGRDLVRLDAFAAFVVVFTGALTVHAFAKIGVPVSITQAAVGAVLGIGWAHGEQGVHLRLLLRIVFAWICSPTMALILSFILNRIAQ